ncbi:MAG: extracellular solute-binding protein [Nitrospiraceae bacterium]|nr:extracellular solute-binding protein [Nitrospiraceae bacterium]
MAHHTNLRTSFRILCATLALAVASVLLAGCKEPLPPEAEGRTIVHVWSGWTGDEEGYFSGLLGLFNESQSEYWAVNTSTIEDDTRIIRALTAGTPPDVFLFWNPANVGVVAKLGCIRPLDERFAASTLRREDFIEGALEFPTIDGKLYAVPFLVDVLGLFYDKQLFIEAGLDPERPPKTFDQLIEYTKILTRFEDGKLRRMGFEEALNRHEALALLGAEFYDAEGRPQFDHPSCIQAVDRLVQLYEIQGGGQEIAAFRAGFGEYTSPNHQFFVHKIAMYTVGQWWPYCIQKYSPGIDYAVAPFPSDVHANGMTFMGGNFMCLAREAANPDGGWAFIRWSQTVEAQLAFCKVMNGMPNIRQALESPEIRTGERMWVMFGKLADIALKAKATFFPPTEISAQYASEIATATQYAVRGTKSPEQACQDAQARLMKAWKDRQE